MNLPYGVVVVLPSAVCLHGLIQVALRWLLFNTYILKLLLPEGCVHDSLGERLSGLGFLVSILINGLNREEPFELRS